MDSTLILLGIAIFMEEYGISFFRSSVIGIVVCIAFAVSQLMVMLISIFDCILLLCVKGARLCICLLGLRKRKQLYAQEEKPREEVSDVPNTQVSVGISTEMRMNP